MTEWRGHSCGIFVPWRPQSLLAAGIGCSNFCPGTGPAHRALRSGLFLPFGAGLCCCSATAGNLGHGVLLRMWRRTVLIEERLISVYDYVCRLCQKFMSNNSLPPTDVPGINQPSSVWLRLDFSEYKLNGM